MSANNTIITIKNFVLKEYVHLLHKYNIFLFPTQFFLFLLHTRFLVTCKNHQRRIKMCLSGVWNVFSYKNKTFIICLYCQTAKLKTYNKSWFKYFCKTIIIKTLSRQRIIKSLLYTYIHTHKHSLLHVNSQRSKETFLYKTRYI